MLCMSCRDPYVRVLRLFDTYSDTSVFKLSAFIFHQEIVCVYQFGISPQSSQVQNVPAIRPKFQNVIWAVWLTQDSFSCQSCSWGLCLALSDTLAQAGYQMGSPTLFNVWLVQVWQKPCLKLKLSVSAACGLDFFNFSSAAFHGLECLGSDNYPHD